MTILTKSQKKNLHAIVNFFTLTPRVYQEIDTTMKIELRLTAYAYRRKRVILNWTDYTYMMFYDRRHPPVLPLQLRTGLIKVLLGGLGTDSESGRPTRPRFKITIF